VSEVSREEEITRYLLEKKEIRSNGKLHWRALLPNKDGETSVYRISGCSENDIWVTGLHDVAAARGKVLVGRGDLKAVSVYDKALNLRADENPTSKHADIIGWPEEKDRLQAIAIDLAADVDVKKI
jgi:hypothetical protein